MTHFIGAVVVPPTVDGFTTEPTKYPTLYGENGQDVAPKEELEDYLDEILAPFDEGMDYEGWISRDEVIAAARARINAFAEGTYAKYQQLGEDAYMEARGLTAGDSHMTYLREEFPKRLEWTDDEVYAYASEDYDTKREDGAVLNTYNPDSKWDWWTIGGRWDGQYHEKQGHTIAEFKADLTKVLTALADPVLVQEAAIAEAKFTDARKEIYRLGDQEKAKAAHTAAWEELQACPAYVPWYFPYNIVFPDPKKDGHPTWSAKGEMGWWGAHIDTSDDASWVREMEQITDALPEDARIYYIDFHI